MPGLFCGCEAKYESIVVCFPPCGFRVWLLRKNFLQISHIYMYMYGSQGYHICTCMVAKAGAFLVPVVMSHSCVNIRLSNWKMLLFIFPMHYQLFQFPLSFLQALPSNVQSEIILPLSRIQMHIKCFFHFCHCVHATQN